jgi:FAD/FMN-containing dehydrogenase
MKQLFNKVGIYFFIAYTTALVSFQAIAQDTPKIVNDITQLNPIKVRAIITPTTNEEIIEAVKTHNGPISIGGGRYSMGGQTATENALQIDMRKFNRVLAFSKTEKEITVQCGITWRKIQEYIDTCNLSVEIMQTYANFTIGGSLSVNVHGRYVGQGPLILSVKQIKIVLANGDLITASPSTNKDIFYGAIGGYGGLGIITEATLSLTDNCKVLRRDSVMPVTKYKAFFFAKVHDDSSIVFHNADFYPNNYKKIRAVSFIKTDKNVTISDRLKPLVNSYGFNKFAYKIVSDFPFGKWIRQHIFDPIIYRNNPVEWRNYEASYDVYELEPKSREKSTYVLQEYFVPVNRFDQFYPLMTNILKQDKVNVINISIRHANKDPGSTLAWARSEVFSFVLYYKQGTSQKDRNKVKSWTQKLTDAVLTCEGSYYLPYQIYATKDQFMKAYPDYNEFFKLKKQLDPDNKFRNKLWDAYY